MTTESHPADLASQRAAGWIDPRGQRFAAAITTVILAVALVLQNPWVLLVQAVVFAVTVALGPASGPYGLIYRTLVRPRISPPHELEDPRPPRFAQLVGLIFAVLGVIGFFSGAWVLGLVATGCAVVAALLNAVIGYCLGCELYLLGRRILPSRSSDIRSRLEIQCLHRSVGGLVGDQQPAAVPELITGGTVQRDGQLLRAGVHRDAEIAEVVAAHVG